MTARGLMSDQGAITEEMMQYRFFTSGSYLFVTDMGKAKKQKKQRQKQKTNKQTKKSSLQKNRTLDIHI